MPPDSRLQAAQQARRGVEAVRRQLVSPTSETLAACTAPLCEAIGCMERLQAELGDAIPRSSPAVHQLRTEVGSLRQELQTVNALLLAAGAFYQGYARLIGAEPETGPITYGAAAQTAPFARQTLAHG